MSTDNHLNSIRREYNNRKFIHIPSCWKTSWINRLHINININTRNHILKVIHKDKNSLCHNLKLKGGGVILGPVLLEFGITRTEQDTLAGRYAEMEKFRF